MPLSILLHGDLNGVSSGSLCAMSIFSIWLLIYVSVVICFISLGIILVLYHQLIIHMKKSGAAAAGQLNLNRDVVVIPRIVQIILASILCGLPFMILFVISLINPSDISDYCLHLVYITVLSAVCAQMIILIIYTPSVKNCLIDHYTNQTQ